MDDGFTQIDFTGAHLNAELDIPVHMHQPPHMPQDDEVTHHSSTPHDHPVCCDNASGNHAFKDIGYFTHMYSNSADININVYTGSYVVCKQQGDIAFINEETEEKETLRNVLYLPEAMMNIISEGKLTKQNPGCWFLTTGKNGSSANRVDCQ